MTHEFEAAEPDTSGLTGRQRVALIFGVVLVGALITFIVQNTDSTQIQFLTLDGDLPRWLVIIGSAAVGSVLTVIVLFFVRRRRG
jgi:uncharacterized integral membrane protein